MKILFWGTPPYAVASLDALVSAGHELVGVVTQPDRRRGRGSALMPSAIKARALELGLPVYCPERIRRDLEMQAQLAALQADLYAVVAYGQILPPDVLAQPPLGCWNGHGSLLPRWRGAAPIQWALIEGDSHTGVGIMAMEEGLDTGPVVLERRIEIGLLENAEQLSQRLAAVTGELLLEALPLIEAAGTGSRLEQLEHLRLTPQKLEGVSYARMLSAQDRQIDWQRSALSIHRQVMGLYPAAWSSWRQKRLKLLSTEPLVERLSEQLSPAAASAARRWRQADQSGKDPEAVADGCGANSPSPGEVLEVLEGVGLVVATGGCPLLIRAGKLEGSSVAAGTRLIQQCAAAAGDRLERSEPAFVNSDIAKKE